MSFNHLDFNVSIISDGRPLPKYDTKLVDSVMTCYIPSEVGKEFAVRIEHSTGLAIRASLRTDGRFMERQLFDDDDLECIFHGVWASPTTLLPFMFRRIEVEDVDHAQNDPVHDKLGIIEVDIQAVQVNSEHVAEWPGLPDNGNAVPVPVPVPERTKKDGHHLTQLGASRECDGVYQSRVSDEDIDPVGPRMIFQFRYLPLHLLLAQGIVPHRTPSAESHHPTGSATRTLENMQNALTMPPRRRKTPPPPIEDIDPRATKRARFSTVFPDVALSIANNLRSIPAFRRICTPYGLFLGQETRASSSAHASTRVRGDAGVQRNLISTQANATRIQVLKETIDAAQAELRDLQAIDLTSDEESD